MRINQAYANCAQARDVQPSGDLDVLMGHAEMAQGPFIQITRALTLELGLRRSVSCVRGPLKDKARIIEKVETKYDGDYSRVTDFCRGRILFNDPKQIKQLRSIFISGKMSHHFHQEWTGRSGYLMVKFQDNFAYPRSHGFRGLSMIISVPLGKGRYHLCELQMMHEGMVELDAISHQYYEMMRGVLDTMAADGRVGQPTTEERAIIDNLQAANRALYDEAAVRLGLDSLRLDRAHTQNEPARLII